MLTGQTLSESAALELAQNDVPEPGSWVLAATALAFIPMHRYWRRRS
jgi:MYXO-CTERM domain-containing protein